MAYQLYFDERNLDGDLAIDYDGVELVIDRMRAPYLDGASSNFADTIEKQGFTIDNPNAAAPAPAATPSAEPTRGGHPLASHTVAGIPVSSGYDGDSAFTGWASPPTIVTASAALL